MSNVKLSEKQKEVIKTMRIANQWLIKDMETGTYRLTYVLTPQTRVHSNTVEALFRRALIKRYTYMKPIWYYQLTNRGFSISID
jgi:hypothetical protein